MRLGKNPRLWHSLGRIGFDTRKRFTLRTLAHRTGVHRDSTMRALDRLQTAMHNSNDFLGTLQNNPPEGPPVLVWPMRGGFGTNAVEGLIAWAIRLRGIDTRVVLCDGLVPLCENKRITFFPGRKVTSASANALCDPCIFQANHLFSTLNLSTLPLTSYLDATAHQAGADLVGSLSRHEILNLTYRGVHLGPIIHSSVVRFLMTLTFDHDPHTEDIIRKYALGAVLICDAADAVLARYTPRALFTSHGLYILWGIVTQLALQRGIPVTTWGLGKRRSTVVLGHGMSHYQELLSLAPHQYETSDWGPERRDAIDTYLHNRRTEDRLPIHFRTPSREKTMLHSLGLESDRLTLGLFPNVAWDAQIYYRNIAFPDVYSWVFHTVDFFSKNPKYQLVIRCHPMEPSLGEGALQSVQSMVLERYGDLPSNVKLIPSGDPLDSYALSQEITAAAVHGTELGLELACRAVPVIVTGGAIYRNKGFTVDVDTADEYSSVLGRLESLRPTHDKVVERARRFAYYYHFQRAIPFKFLSHQAAGLADISLNNLGDLSPGKDPNLDVIVQGILSGRRVLAVV